MKIVLILISLLFSTWLGVFIINKPGYVLIVYDMWTLEMPLWLPLVALILIGLCGSYVHYLYRTVTGVAKILRKTLCFNASYRQKLTQYNTLAALLKEDWCQVEKYALKIKQDKNSTIYNCFATLAALKQGKIKSAKKHLERTILVNGKQNNEIYLLSAIVAYEQGYFLESIALSKKAEISCVQLRYILQSYLQLNKPQYILTLLVQHGKWLSLPEQILLLEQALEKWLLTQPAEQDFWQQWHKMPKRIKYHEKLLLTMSPYIQQHDNHEIFLKLIQASLEASWSENLIGVYSVLKGSNKQLTWLEKYKHKHQSPMLLLALGRLSMRQNLWGQAKTYLEQSLAIHPSVAARLELALLQERLQDTDAALLYRQAAEESSYKLLFLDKTPG